MLRSRRSSSGRSSDEHPRANARDRFKPRRRGADRRSCPDEPAPTERREGSERRKGDRRQPEDGFSREEAGRLEQMLQSPDNRQLLLRGTKVACPRCRATLRLRRVATWKGAEPTWELRCTKCRRSMFVRPGSDR